MNYNKLEYFVSKPRLDRFLLACGNSQVQTQKLYEINLKVAQATYPILNLFEIFLRNSINDHISKYFNDPDWIINEKNGFMIHKSLASSKFFLKNSIQTAQNTISKKGGTVTAGKIIAEQSFGFWVSLFDTHHYKLIGGSPIHCFKNKPTTINRKTISIILNKVRGFRNRVYHNEPICFKTNQINFTEVQIVTKHIYDMLSWIDADLKIYVESFDLIDTQINLANNL